MGERRKYKRLKYSDRKKIEELLRDRRGIAEIADAVGVHRDTIYKEIRRSGLDEFTYNAADAQKAL